MALSYRRLGLIGGITLWSLFLLGSGPSSATTHFIFTIDVCWTAGEDFQGRWDGKDYGVPLIVDKLEKHGFKGSFFVSPYVPARLEDKMLANLRYLISRGQDLQLHTHPDSFDSKRPLLCDYSVEERRRILDHGVKTMVRAGARPPVAHRAGNLSIDEDTLRILPEFGIHLDSSIYHRSAYCRVELPESQVNRIAEVCGVYELPIMLIRTVPFAGGFGTTALQLDSTVWQQQKVALEEFAAHNVPVVVFFLHFFSFCKVEPAKHPFEPLIMTGIRPDKIAEFDNILELISRDERFNVVTVSRFWDIFRKNPERFETASFIPFPGLVPTYIKCLKYSGESFPAAIVAVTPFAFLLAVVLVVWSLRIRKRT